MATTARPFGPLSFLALLLVSIVLMEQWHQAEAKYYPFQKVGSYAFPGKKHTWLPSSGPFFKHAPVYLNKPIVAKPPFYFKKKYIKYPVFVKVPLKYPKYSHFAKKVGKFPGKFFPGRAKTFPKKY